MRSGSKQQVSGLQPVVLKPQDVALALKIVLLENRLKAPDQADAAESPPFDRQPLMTLPIPKSWTLAQLAKKTYLSIGEVHNVLHRLLETRLLRSEGRRINRHALEDFMIHGMRYAFPAARGAATRGLPTAYAAPMLKDRFLSSGQEVPVWPYANGAERGIAFSPLYAAAPAAALDDPEYYEMLAIADMLRGEARAREQAAAADLLQSYLTGKVSW
jgi:hypothetical protein